MKKYIVIKKNPKDGQTYEVQLSSDEELKNHIRGTFECTDHILVAVINTNP